MVWEHLAEQLREIQEGGRYRTLREIQSPSGRLLVHGDHEYLNFSSNNYLGLAGDPRLKEAMVRGVEKYGVGSGAARLITGSMEPWHQLENELARFKATEAALVFNSGYQANVGVLSSLLSEDAVVFSDELNHASLIDGIRLSKAARIIYPHNNLEELRQRIRKQKLLKKNSEIWVVSESVFSMDGDLCDLGALLDLVWEEGARLYLDEAHATGVFGETGAGLAEDFRDHPAWEGQLVQMGTLGKALGCFGAYIAGPQVLIDFLINHCRTFIFATALPPALACAALEALNILSERAYRRDTLWQRLEFFQREVQTSWKANAPKVVSPIIPLVVGGEKTAVELSKSLAERGYWVNAIRPPTVAPGSSRLRITLMATHTEEDIRGLVAVLKESRSEPL
jgi:8-amino-7-oxononanoate synthase